jgi:hypothetical protein
MTINGREAEELSGCAVALCARLLEAVAPTDGQPWGKITKEEARALARDLVRLAASLVRAAMT